MEKSHQTIEFLNSLSHDVLIFLLFGEIIHLLWNVTLNDPCNDFNLSYIYIAELKMDLYYG